MRNLLSEARLHHSEGFSRRRRRLQRLSQLRKRKPLQNRTLRNRSVRRRRSILVAGIQGLIQLQQSAKSAVISILKRSKVHLPNAAPKRRTKHWLVLQRGLLRLGRKFVRTGIRIQTIPERSSLLQLRLLPRKRTIESRDENSRPSAAGFRRSPSQAVRRTVRKRPTQSIAGRRAIPDVTGQSPPPSHRDAGRLKKSPA